MRRSIFIFSVVLFLAFSILLPRFVSAAIPKAGLQAADDACTSWGDPQYTPTGGTINWAIPATDSNHFNPDCYRVFLDSLGDQDFRALLVGSDDKDCVAPYIDSTQRGPIVSTPWASQGGGWSGWTSQHLWFDPDCVRIGIETRPYQTTSFRPTNARLGLKLSDTTCTAQYGDPKYTPWTKNGGGWAPYFASDSNFFDPDCIAVGLEVEANYTGYVAVEIKSTDGTPIYGTWDLVEASTGRIVKSQTTPAQAAVYADIPYGTYKLIVPDSLTQVRTTYNLESIKNAGGSTTDTQTLGSTSPPACPAGQANPHLGCQNNACVSITGCGVSDCSICSGSNLPPPGGQIPFNNFWQGLRNLFSFNRTQAAVGSGESDPHYECVNLACEMVPGLAQNECSFNAQCGGPSAPPPSGDTGTPPPPPTAITFTVTYTPVTTPPPGGSGVPVCSPRTQTVIVDTVANLTATGTAPLHWETQGGTPNSADNTYSFLPSYSTTGTKTVTVSNSLGSDSCTVEVVGTGGPGLVTCTFPDGTQSHTQYAGEKTPLMTASGGSGSYNWLATGGNPGIVLNSKTFETTYSTAGTYYATTTDLVNVGYKAACQIIVRPKLFVDCGVVNTMTVNSNVPATWDITGPSPQSQTIPETSKTYDAPQAGTYVFYPGYINGYYVESVQPGAIQTITQEGNCRTSITFDVTYKQNSVGNPVCYLYPQGQTSIEAGKQATFFVRSGWPNYNWYAAEGDPQFGGPDPDNGNPQGAMFLTTFNTTGIKTVTVRDGLLKTGSCTANVTPSCPDTPTLTVQPGSQNVTACLDSSAYKAIYDSDGATCGGNNTQDVTTSAIWSSTNEAVATVKTPGVYHGIKAGTVSARATYKGLTSSATLNVQANSDPACPDPDKDFVCTVTPDTIVLPQGESRIGTVSCTPAPRVAFTGPIALSPRNLPSASGLTFSPNPVSIPPDPTVAAYTFTAASTTPPGNYDVIVRGTSGSLQHDYPLTVEVQPKPPLPPENLCEDPNAINYKSPAPCQYPVLEATLKADPASGTEPLDSKLTATTTPALPGQTTNFTFWWDCAYRGTSIDTAKAQCGDPDGETGNANGAKFDGKAAVSQTTPAHRYGDGTYTPLVIVERGSQAAYAITTIKVDPATCPDGSPMPADGICPVSPPTGGGTCSAPTTWNNTTDYTANWVVIYAPSGNKYISLRANKNINPISDPTAWSPINCNGGGGDSPGTCSAPTAWSSAITYTSDWVVDHSGQKYVSLKSNKGVVPTSDSSVWALAKCPGGGGGEGTCSAPTDWTSSTNYTADWVVTYNSRHYVSLEANRNVIPASNPSIWKNIDCSTGGGDPPGTCLAPTGWDATVTYTANWVVAYNGQNYVSLKPNKNVIPTSDPTTWKIVECGGNPSAKSCEKFTAKPPTIVKGNSSNLEWSCTNVSTCNIYDPKGKLIKSNGPVSIPTEPVLVTPTSTTIYTLNCDSGDVQRQTKVNVVEDIHEIPPGE